MKSKDFLIVILLVIGFYASTFYLWVNYNHIAKMFFLGLFFLAIGTLLICAIVAMKNSIKNN